MLKNKEENISINSVESIGSAVLFTHRISEQNDSGAMVREIEEKSERENEVNHRKAFKGDS